MFDTDPETLPALLNDVFTQPQKYFIRRWNWKSALTSSLIRGLVFFFANLKTGFAAAMGAFFAELIFRGLGSGFFGSLTQAFRRVEPASHAMLGALFIVPAVSHVIEFAVHWLRGTPQLKTSVIASLSLTLVSTLFNIYIMRRGALVVGPGADTLKADMKRMPRLIIGFISAAPRLLRQLFST